LQAVWLKYREIAEKEDFLRKFISKKTICLPPEYDVKKDEDLHRKLDVETFYLKQRSNVRIQIENVFDSTIDIIDLYYICDGCGHIYWEGPHWQNITHRFAHVLSASENNQQS